MNIEWRVNVHKQIEESYGLEELHQLLLKALEKIDRVCRENNIFYSLCGGTLLGAERNKKFIPWDDDADLCMTREQFDKLYEVINDLGDSSCKLDRTLLWVPRFIYKDVDKTVFVDIFIWDYISEMKWQRFLKIFILRLMQGMMKSKIDYRKYGIIQKSLLFISHVLGKLFSRETKRDAYDYISKNLFIGKKEYVHCSNDTFSGLQYVFDKDYIQNYMDLELEERKFMANKRYKESLVNYYGNNYMVPPPVEKRKPAHQGIIEKINNG